MSNYKHVLLAFILFAYSANNVCLSTSFSKNLPKTKSVSKNQKKSIPNDESFEDSVNADDIEKTNPGLNYKLIAIYLIGNKARVLLKDGTQPDVPAKEYQVGDFLDDAQTITISKINFNPTARIELTDESGISYLLKPQNTEDSKNSGSMTGSGSLPTYFSAGKNKTTKRSSSSSNFTPPPPPISTNAPQSANSDSKKDDSSKLDAPKQEASSGQALKAIDAVPPPPEAMQQLPPIMNGELDRPSNPFE